MSSKQSMGRCAHAVLIVAIAALSACGGGDEASSSPHTKQPNQAAAQAQGIPTASANATTYKGDGWHGMAVPEVAVDKAYTATYSNAIYVSTSGLNTNPGTNPDQPKKTLDSLTADVLANKQAVLLKCTDTWHETLDLVATSTTPRNLVIGAYGCGSSTTARPRIRGTVEVPHQPGAALPWSLIGGAWTHKYAKAPEALYRGDEQLIPASYPSQLDKNQPTYQRVGALSGGNDKNSFKVDDITKLKIGSDKTRIVGATMHIKTATWGTESAKVTDYDPLSGTLTFERYNASIPPEERSTKPEDKLLQQAVTADTGYILEGKYWMMDAPDEWVYDLGKLYVMARAGDTSTNADTLAIEAAEFNFGIRLTKLQAARIERVQLDRQIYDAVRTTDSAGVVIRDIRVPSVGQRGVFIYGNRDLPTIGATVEDSAFTNYGNTGLEVREVLGPVVQRNRFARTLGTTPVVANYSSALYIAGNTSSARTNEFRPLVRENVVRNAAGTGIRLASYMNADVLDNTVISSCELYTDCGGIYAGGRNFGIDKARPAADQIDGTVIKGNIVAGATGNLNGSFNSTAKNLAVGIYLDEESNQVKVLGNTVTDTETGIYLHDAFSNVIDGNTIRNVKHASISAFEQRKVVILVNNTISNNKLVSYRAVKVPDGNNEIVDLNEYAAETVYAQAWGSEQHELTGLFDGSLDTQPNKVYGNTVLTVANGQKPVWRRQFDARMRDGGGAAWWLKAKDMKPYALSIFQADDWAAFTSLSRPADKAADTAIAPVFYWQYQLGLANDNGGAGLVLYGKPMDTTKWFSYRPNGGQFTSCGTGCAQLTAASANEFVRSNPFSISTRTNDNLYVVQYGARSASATQLGSIRLFTYQTGVGPAGLNTPAVILPASNGFTTFEQFFHAKIKDKTVEGDEPNIELQLKAVGQPTANDSAENLNTPVQFGDVRLYKVNGVTYRPSMNQLSMHIINFSTQTQQVDPATLSQDGATWLTESGAPLGAGAINIEPRKSVHLFKASIDKWQAPR